MTDPELFNETIQDVKDLRDKIADRHKDDPTFVIRVSNVFNSFLNSMSHVSGEVIYEGQGVVSGGFKPKPLESVLGQKVHNVPTKMILPEIKQSEQEQFKEDVKNYHDNFTNLENTRILELISQMEIRGVAKLSGMDDYRDAEINSEYVQAIKDKIIANRDAAAAADLKKNELENRGNVEVKNSQTDNVPADVNADSTNGKDDQVLKGDETPAAAEKGAKRAYNKKGDQAK